LLSPGRLCCFTCCRIASATAVLLAAGQTSCRLKVEEYQKLTPESFTERYTALVQRLSLMLLQVRQ
jgi:hypothetical protein